MLIQIDVTKLPSYQLGLEPGREDGLERGLATGMDRGRMGLLLRQLRVQFGPLPPELEARVQAAGGGTD